MELLEKHFDIALTAPDGIKRLRDLILTLAMQGVLVPQDSSDQPACELLKEIRTEKNLLVKAGKIKASKPLPEIKPEDVPYTLPQGWEWVRLGEIGIIGSSSRVHQADWKTNGVPFYRAREIVKLSKFGFVENELFIEESLYQTLTIKSLVPEPGDVMITGVGTIGIPYVVEERDKFYFKDASVLVFKNYFRILPAFLFKLFNSQLWIDSIHKDSMGTTVHTLTIVRANETIVPLPPLAEQHRIVAKINQLLARCDELEKLRTELEQKRIDVHSAALNGLLRSQETGRFADAWQFITDHFAELYSVRENVVELRKAILQLGVMGRLMPQDPNDQSASSLVKKIEKEKIRLVKAGEIKRPKPVPLISREDETFPVPSNWRWVRIAELAESIDYGTSQKTCDDATLVPVYRMGNIVDGQLIDNGFKYISPSIDELPRLYLQPNDILFNRTNSYELVGKSALYIGPNKHATFASYLIRIRLFDGLIDPKFISMAMNAPYFRKTQIEPEIVQQCGQANFNGSKLSLCLIPLPPLAEQQRIIARTDQFMAMCDELDRQIIAASDRRVSLLNAVMTQI